MIVLIKRSLGMTMIIMMMTKAPLTSTVVLKNLSLGCSAFPDTSRKLVKATGGSNVIVILSPACWFMLFHVISCYFHVISWCVFFKGKVFYLRHESPEEGLPLISPCDAVVLVMLDRAL